MHNLSRHLKVAPVSADGSVIVGGDGTGRQGMMWDSVHGLRQLKGALANDYRLDLDEWTLNYSTGVSADGRTIIGSGVNPAGYSEAWIAVIPEPASGLLLVCAV